MTGPGRRFDPAELRDAGLNETHADVADVLVAARKLEALAARDVVTPSPEFDDRVMAAIALEAPPRVVIAGGAGFMARLAGFWGAVGSAWRVATSGGHPVAIRAQALAFVLLVVLATGSLASVAAIGAANLLDQPNAPRPTIAPNLTPTPLPTPLPTPTVEPTAPAETLVPSEEPSPTVSEDPSESPEATETAEATDDHGGASPTKTPKPTAKPTPRPTRTPRATETPEPHESEEPDGTDDHGGSGDDEHGGSGSG